MINGYIVIFMRNLTSTIHIDLWNIEDEKISHLVNQIILVNQH